MFGIICPGRPVQTLHPLSPTTFIHSLPLPVNHIVVFLLPEAHLPETHAASVHIQFPNQPFRILGAISAQKPSAIFRIGGLQSPPAAGDAGGGGGGEVVVGVSIEEVGRVAELVSGIPAAAAGTGGKRVETVVLARRIIRDAFNFLSSFAGAAGGAGGEEVVPLKAFRDWWAKFEKKVELDPGFLERGGED
ncbi:DUF775-domain-containing protein [Choiromyces venosus 120613-1]|uniref:DUF775-domain-containing protein n=1 Tax=Choiromyces venosus 120613-1 TaxID=1336337 RepID=A0A3N4K9L9_9PEZI|nr:DUF775-domain-containing protein [Choiromyces venosus 120613-1]